jgi:toxin FitB
MLGDHESRPAVVEALTGTRPGLAGHAWFETYSVLTRLPAPQRRPPGEISSALLRNFPETRWLAQAATAELAARCAGLGIAGGAVYDALVAAVALAEDLPLLTRDLRALGTYQAIGARVLPIT